ncbi:conserved phage C-terminal domain-containing protein [Entomohabitans teleogrylli]|uniref:conserved phage C-terminal domain-containing protein n=1 Tax=Entomohabitans teleogrylli TaxID=1384589 RepID=UPI00073D2EC5|nr:conserved phage C-terminal domain-containing protein [Entomohabitans teleogrylli]
MSVKLSAWVWDGCAAYGLKGTRLLVMARLADFSSDEGIAFPSVETIARQIGAGRSTVITAIGDLEREGWLTRKERRKGQRNSTNIYTLNVRKLRQAADGAYSHSPESERSKPEHSESERSESECSETERTESGKKAVSHRPESGGDPSVNSNTDPSDKKPFCQVAGQPDPEVEITEHAKRVLTHLNQSTGSRYQVCKSSMENIRARLGDGFTPAELVLVVDYSVEKWGRDLKMAEYLRPTTLFLPSKFPGYLQSATKWDAAGRPEREKWGKRNRSPDDQAFRASYADVDYTRAPEGFRT